MKCVGISLPFNHFNGKSSLISATSYILFVQYVKFFKAEFQHFMVSR